MTKTTKTVRLKYSGWITTATGYRVYRADIRRPFVGLVA